MDLNFLSVFKYPIALALYNNGISSKKICKILRVKHSWIKTQLLNPEIITFNFGVELETKYEGDVHLPSEFKLFKKLGYHDQPNGFDIQNKYHWRQMYDGSIGRYGEYISPILKGMDGIKTLEIFTKALESMNPIVDKDCGFHLHISKDIFEDSNHIERFTKLYGYFEECIDSIMPVSRRKNNNGYCRTVNRPNVDWDTKYLKVNLRNRNTVEIRHHYGTVNFEEIHNWIIIMNVIIQKSKSEETYDLSRKTRLVNVLKGRNKMFYQKKVKTFS